MATVIIDANEDVHVLSEEVGAASSFKRTCLITGLTSGSSTPLAERMAEARTAMDTNFPYFGTTLLDSNLRVVSREFSTIPGSTTAVKCVVTYQSRKDVLGPVGTWTPVLSGTVNQIQVPNDIGGFPIILRHTFPDDDENHPGQLIEQGAKVPQMRPVVEITYTGLQQPASIFDLEITYLGKTNLTTWNYGNPGYWLCTNFQAQIHDAGTTPVTWLCDVTFQADAQAWDPMAVFIDPATGQQPPNLVRGVGYRQVITQERADFNNLIPTG